MSKELPYFQFEPAQWMMGRIQRCSNSVKGAYMDLCSRYWNDECVMSVEDAELDCGLDEVQELLKRKIITETDGMIEISFLDDQIKAIEESAKEQSKKGSIGNLKRWHPEIYAEYQKKKITLSEAFEIATRSQRDRPPIATRSHPDRHPIAPATNSDRQKSQIREDEIKGNEIRENEIKGDEIKKESTTSSNEEATPKKNEYGKPEINNLMDFLKSHLGGAPPDLSVKNNRNAAQRLLQKVKKHYPGLDAIESIKLVVTKSCELDSFQRKKCTNWNYIEQNFTQLTQIANTQPNGKQQNTPEQELDEIRSISERAIELSRQSSGGGFT